jgi:hypothetical protein
MDPESQSKWIDQTEPGAWRYDEPALAAEDLLLRISQQSVAADPDPQDQSKLLELLGLINYKILSGHSVYLEEGGSVYKVLFGVYWRSVFTGAEHYMLRCEEIVEGMWMEGSVEADEIDLPISYTKDGWLAQGHSLAFILYQD